MLTFDRFRVIGVLAVPDQGNKFTVEGVRRDLHALQEGGVDAFVIENHGDTATVQYSGIETESFFRKVLGALRSNIEIPFGVCLLPPTDFYHIAAHGVAEEFGADFVWQDTLVDSVKVKWTHEPMEIRPNPRTVMQYKRKPLFVEIKPGNFYELLDQKPVETCAQDAVANGADSICLVRYDAFRERWIERARAAVPDCPLGITGGINARNIGQYVGRTQYAVVFSYFRERGNHHNAVEAPRVRRLMSALGR